MTFRAFLRQKAESHMPIFFDGGMGTMIQESGITEYDIPEDLNFTHPYIIRGIHAKYLEAGADIITANSFGATPLKMEGRQYSASHTVQTAVSLARSSVNSFTQTNSLGEKLPKFAALDIGPTGCLLEPSGPLSFDDAYASYAATAIAGEQAGADLAIIETMSDLYETKAAILAVKETTMLPIIATATFQENMRTLSGASIVTCVTYLESLGVDAIGLNCGIGLDITEKIVEQFLAVATVPVIVQPNAGLPVLEHGKTVFKVTPSEFAESQLHNFTKGAAILGGCCGTTPAHIEATVKLINKYIHTPNFNTENKAKQHKKLPATRICSGTKTVTIGGSYGPVIIGERINPTGKKKCKEALINSDMNFVIHEAEVQLDAGAHILDVNVGLPGIDEKMIMYDAIYTLQKTFSCPLQIDSSDPAVLELAMRKYNGKPLVNSVNGKQEVMNKIFPLIKKYGGAVVALCLDEKGIPSTAEERVVIAKKIINEAAKYGITKKDILIDTLTLTISSQQKEASETLKAISLLKRDAETVGVKTVLGVSNISFGLPRRDLINSNFFSMALCAGLDGCIINPLSESMMDSFRSFRAIYGYDENSMEFISKYKDSKITTQSYNLTTTNDNASATNSNVMHSELYEIIVKGFVSQAETATTNLLKTTVPMDIVNKHIVPALDAVGKDYGEGKKFLPQLLLSAETVSMAFSKIKAYLKDSGEQQKLKGKVLLATVHGDIHDIGKNIVAAMLENYGYEVIDLGKDVPAEKIIETAEKENVKIIGLSALMTTTVLSMEKTIKKIRESETKRQKDAPNFKYTIVVGGAVLTPEYAKQIGADFFGADAMATVSVAKEILS